MLLAEYTENLLSSGKAACVITGWVEINDNAWEAAVFLMEQKEAGKAGPALSGETLEKLYAGE